MVVCGSTSPIIIVLLATAHFEPEKSHTARPENLAEVVGRYPQ